MPVEPPARPDLATSLTAILPRIEALHAERAALNMQRLLENGGNHSLNLGAFPVRTGPDKPVGRLGI